MDFSGGDRYPLTANDEKDLTNVLELVLKTENDSERILIVSSVLLELIKRLRK